MAVVTLLFAVFALVPKQEDGVWSLGVVKEQSQFWLTYLTAVLGLADLLRRYPLVPRAREIHPWCFWQEFWAFRYSIRCAYCTGQISAVGGRRELPQRVLCGRP